MRNCLPRIVTYRCVPQAARPNASWAEEEILVNFVLLLLYAFREGELSLGALRGWLLEVRARFPLPCLTLPCPCLTLPYLAVP